MTSRGNAPILPGATIGILGSGQLGRMLAIEARKMGFKVHTYSPDSQSPTGQIADKEVVAQYDDLEKVAEFAKGVDVITFEFENVLSQTTEVAERYVPVRPCGRVLHTTQNRLREKTFLQEAEIPVAPFRSVRSLEELKAALTYLGTPAVLKTAGFGYDGKGQSKITSIDQAEAAWKALKTDEAVLEGFIDFKRELSIIGARGVDGSFAHFAPVENIHRNHILDFTIAPAPNVSASDSRAVEILRAIMEKLDVIGVLCVELFETKSGELIVNELAPRPHNSGHYTFDACITSQFEQQLRAICGLPVGDTTQLMPAVMANLLGDVWDGGTPQWDAALKLPGVKLHVYGKAQARAGRKMGHLTVLAASTDEAMHIADEARKGLTRAHK